MDIKNIHVPFDSPIEVNIINDMMNQTINKVMEDMDNAIYKSVVHAGFNVDKDKLVEVFTQDKRRYEEAYRKGYAQRDADIIRCKDCKWWQNGICMNDNVSRMIHDCGCYPDFMTDGHWYCPEGKRKDGDGDG